MPNAYATERYQGAEDRAEARHEMWAAWPVNWSAVWVGALAALALVLVFGLIGIALGAHILDPQHRVVDLRATKLETLALSVFAAFISFAVGGWTAGKIAGILRSEPAMLHGAIVWLLSIPLLLMCMAAGAGSLFGGWYGGLAGGTRGAATTPFERPTALSANASSQEHSQYATELSDYSRNIKQWHEDTPKATRNSAIGAVTALLLGLVGAVIGGWMASGEPMTLTHYRSRQRATV